MGNGQEDGSRAGASTGSTAEEHGSGDSRAVEAEDGLGDGSRESTGLTGGRGVGGEGDGETDDSGKKKAGFKRSIVTVVDFPRFRMTKVFSDRFRTWNGPSYGGTKGRLTASMRRKT